MLLQTRFSAFFCICYPVGTGFKRWILARISWNRDWDTNTSAIWHVTYWAWLTTLAPILTSFSRPMSKFIHNQYVLKEPIQAIRCAAQPRNFHPKFCPKSSHASQTPNVVNLYLTNINHFFVKFKKMRLVLTLWRVFSKSEINQFKDPPCWSDYAENFPLKFG